jgi:hypothetical protein
MFLARILKRQKALPVTCKGDRLGKECIVEVMLNNTVILEFKSKEALLPDLVNCSKLDADFKPYLTI